MHFTKNKLFLGTRTLIGPFFVFVAWWLFRFFNVVNPIFLPGIFDTAHALVGFFMEKGTLHVLFTLYRTLAGFLIAALVGISLGLFVGINRKVYRSIEVLIDFFRSLPASALFPLFLLVFGIGDASKIAISAFTVFWTVFLNTIHGVWNIPPVRIEVAKVYQASKFQLMRDVIIFDSLPQILVGLRIGLSLSLIIVIVSETFVGCRYGIGKSLYESYAIYDTPQIYALIVVAGFLGFFLNKSLLFIEKRVIHWAGE